MAASDVASVEAIASPICSWISSEICASLLSAIVVEFALEVVENLSHRKEGTPGVKIFKFRLLVAFGKELITEASDFAWSSASWLLTI